MLEDRLQVTVDRLAERLERSVVLEDAAFRPLAISAQLGVVDQSRIDYVLQRRTNGEIRAVIDAHGVRTATGLVRIPPDEDRGLAARAVLPVLRDGHHLGYLWLIDEPALTDGQLDDARAYADEVGLVLADRISAATDASDTARRLVDDLVRAGRGRREAAADELESGRGPLDGPGPYTLCVVRPGPASSPSRDDGDAAVLRGAASRLRSRTGQGVVASGTPRDDLVCVTSARRTALVVQALRAVAPDCVAGTRTVDRLATAREVLPDARFAAEVAHRVPSFGGVADWHTLGPYAALQSVERTPAGLERLCPGVGVLREEGNEVLLETLRAYLSEQGNVPRAAATLHVHRTTVYWRVTKVQQLLGVNLADGDDRLALHLALKLAELLP